MRKITKNLIATLLIICNVFIIAYETNAENEMTEVTDIVVFIDEKPINSYFSNGTNYIAVNDINNYGFDVLVENNNMNIKRNPDKELSFPDKTIVNITKEEYLNQNTYQIYDGKAYVTIDDKKINSKSINGEEYIAVRALEKYAVIIWDQEAKTAKLDIMKKEFERKEQAADLATINYSDFISGGYNKLASLPNDSEFKLLNHIGEVDGEKRAGFGRLNLEYLDGDKNAVNINCTGYWDGNKIIGGNYLDEELITKAEVPQSQSIYRVTDIEELMNSYYIEIDIDYNNKENSKRIERRRKYKDTTPEGIDGTVRIAKIDGLVQISKIDEKYKFGYRIVNTGIWEDDTLLQDECFIPTDKEFNEIFDEIFKETVLWQLVEYECYIPTEAELDDLYYERFTKDLTPYMQELFDKMDAVSEDYYEGIYIPGSVDECIVELKKSLPEETLNELKNIDEKNLSGTHFGLGLWIRNNLLYGPIKLRTFFYKNGIFHVDDMSSIIVKALHKDLNGKEFDFDKSVKKAKANYVSSKVSGKFFDISNYN